MIYVYMYFPASNERHRLMKKLFTHPAPNIILSTFEMLKFGPIGLLSAERKAILWLQDKWIGGSEMGRKTPTGMINCILMTKSLCQL